MTRKFEECTGDDILNISTGQCVVRTDKDQVGDGKLPNKYFVSLSDSELICKKDSEGVTNCDWDVNTGSKGGTVAVADTYQEAKDFLKSIGIEEDVNVKGSIFSVTSKTIEDRFSGELASEVVENFTRTVTDRETLFCEDTKFSEDQMSKLGAVFK